jgi:hypothetical protein
MYTYINPVRADYHACKLYDDESAATKTENYIVKGTSQWKVVLQDYKTYKSYGKIEINVPEVLHLLLVEYLRLYPRVYLFENDSGEPFTRKTFSTWSARKLEQAFKSPMTLTAIRHSFTGSLDYNVSTVELRGIGESMGHSVGTQRQYRWENEVIVPE